MGPDKPTTPWTTNYPSMPREEAPASPPLETDEERWKREADQEVEEILSDDYSFDE
jgi:hypothetical protein